MGKINQKKKKETGHVQKSTTDLDYSQMLRAVWRAGWLVLLSTSLWRLASQWITTGVCSRRGSVKKIYSSRGTVFLNSCRIQAVCQMCPCLFAIWNICYPFCLHPSLECQFGENSTTGSPATPLPTHLSYPTVCIIIFRPASNFCVSFRPVWHEQLLAFHEQEGMPRTHFILMSFLLLLYLTTRSSSRTALFSPPPTELWCVNCLFGVQTLGFSGLHFNPLSSVTFRTLDLLLLTLFFYPNSAFSYAMPHGDGLKSHSLRDELKKTNACYSSPTGLAFFMPVYWITLLLSHSNCHSISPKEKDME